MAGGHNWHVQTMGGGPALVLIHGTGASTHSWRDLMPLLARHFTVIAPDLPGHGFTETSGQERFSLPAMAQASAALLKTLDVSPMLVVGHSAGVAIGMRMVLDGAFTPKVLVSLNGALLPFRGIAAQLFPSLAKLLVLNPLVPRFFAWRAESVTSIEALLAGTGSRLDARGIELYQRLFSNRAHVAATLAMMANWDLEPLGRDFRKFDLPVVLVVGASDKAVSPADAVEVAKRLPNARIETIKGVGHLIHEERPEQVAALIFSIARQHSVLASE
jgi:magnesium chelatase accessory protein